MSGNHSHEHNSTKNIKVAFFLNITFTIFEILGGIWTNSVAILSDAIHDLGDSLSLGLSWYLDKKSKQGANNRFTFGYRRFSLLGALINGIVLVSGSIFLLFEIIPRLVEPQHANAQGMLIFALFGIVVNGAAVLQVRGGKSMNERVVSLHLLEDVLGWVSVLIVSVILIFWDIPILDPILSLVILSYVLFNVVKNVIKTMSLFLQGVPSDIDLPAIEKQLNEIESVFSVHQVQVWSLDGAEHILTIHIVVDETISVTQIIDLKRKVKEQLQKHNVGHSTIEIEYKKEDCIA